MTVKTPDDFKKSDDLRVFRGGSWYEFVPSGVRASICFTYAPSNRYGDVGFRTTLAGREPRV